MYAYAVLPDGTRRTLLRIPDWNFNWQRQYRYATPIRLPADTRVEMEYTYDNSAANPRNPNHPPARIAWGPATTDEMAGLHLEVVPVRRRRHRRAHPGPLGQDDAIPRRRHLSPRPVGQPQLAIRLP